jgi:DNA invertase Pin-like site-specific DNA recombinase
MAWAIDRLGRSLIDLLGTIQHLEAAGVDLYLDQQSIDTTTPMGKLLFQITGAFAVFERIMIRQRIHAGLKTVKATIIAKGKFTARSSGIVRERLGRPNADPKKVEAARCELRPDRRLRECLGDTRLLESAAVLGLVQAAGGSAFQFRTRSTTHL